MSATHSLNSFSTHEIELGGPVPLHHEDARSSSDPALEKESANPTPRSLQRPRKERRGILANLSLVPEYNDARQYPTNLKNLIVFIISFASLIGPMGTSIVFPAIENMTTELRTSTMMINVSVGIYLLSIGIFPLWWSCFSERFGRRSIYILSFGMYCGFCIGSAMAPNINALIVFRVLTGGCSASVQSVGAGTVSDLFAPEQRGRALGYFYLGALMAPLLSPIIGSLILLRWNWRGTQWFMVILSVVMLMSVVFFLPETLREQDNKAIIAQILAERRKKMQTSDIESIIEEGTTQDEELQVQRIMSHVSRASSRIEVGGDGPHDVVMPEMYRETTHHHDHSRDPILSQIRENDIKKYRSHVESIINKPLSKFEQFKSQSYEFIIRPMKSVTLLKYPPVALAITFSAISFGILYLVNMTIEYEFAREPYKWRSLFVGLAYIPNSVTYIIASVYGGKWTDWLYTRYKRKHGEAVAEARISWNILSAVVVFPVALLIIGWCFHFHTFWVTPLIGTALFGYASMMTIGPVVTYIVDSLPGRGATGVALNNLVRQSLATIAVFVTDPAINGMGVGPLYSLLAGLVVLAALSLVLLKRKGTHWRETYDLQKLYDGLE